MKICVDGIVRDMTPEEEKMFDFTDEEVNEAEAYGIIFGGAE